MDKLPPYRDLSTRSPVQRSQKLILFFVKLISVGILVYTIGLLDLFSQNKTYVELPLNASQIVQKCQALRETPGHSPDFYKRLYSDRYAEGTKPVLIKNASIWTGGASGREVIQGDLLLENGMIRTVGSIRPRALDGLHNLVSLEASGSWITPGIVDAHSHLGVDSSPALHGANDGNSHFGPILPWLRSIDGLNTHDDAYRLSISGGVTTSLVLPGSANAIGGQAFVIKLRPTAERSPSSMLLEPPFNLNASEAEYTGRPRWRQMKHACGENPSRVYSGTRMDTIWAFRQGYDTATKIKESQDEYCTKVFSGKWDGLGNFPENLQWEALVDVLRGRVKVHTHCYEAVDLDGLVRLSNEFKFPIAAFHHAHETYLVPDLLKKAYGHPPAAALFATNARYKREAYRGSEFAPRILAENGLQVIMKSDHPVLNSRHLLYEAQQAHYYGLPWNLALASVTSTPAQVLGHDHRIGFIKPGYDADIVLWDSHPLSLAAAPKQVWIDGIPQIKSPHVSIKPSSLQHIPHPPNFDKEAKEAVKYEGLPPLVPKTAKGGIVIFTNVSNVFLRGTDDIREIFSTSDIRSSGVVVVRNGSIICSGIPNSCLPHSMGGQVEWIDLEGGAISPGLVSFGSPLGLQDIQGEPSTYDGWAGDPLVQNLPQIAEDVVLRAFDGLQFSSRDALLAYRSGVTLGITSPKARGFLSGLSTAFSTGAAHKLVKGAVVQEEAALHVALAHVGVPSVSTQIFTLRRLLLDDNIPGEIGTRFQDVRKGTIPLVVDVHSADIIASLIKLKQEVESQTNSSLRITISGASEAHLLAKELKEAGVGVILTPSRPFPGSWESRRILPGPPLTENNAASILLSHNVTVGIGIEEQWSARSTRFDIAWAALEANQGITKAQALALASTNLERLLGIHLDASQSDYVATRGGDLLDFQSKIVGIISGIRGVVEMV